MPVRRRPPAPRGIPATVLIACQPFAGGPGAERVGEALARGLREGGREEIEVLALPADAAGADPRAALDAAAYDARMRGARAVVIAAERLSPHTLAGSTAFELATRARQSGVPAYAVARSTELDAFGERIMDLQVVLRASGPRALAAAGRRLAQLL